MRLKNFLKTLPAFGSLSDDEAENLARAMRVQDYPDRHEFVRQGERVVTPAATDQALRGCRRQEAGGPQRAHRPDRFIGVHPCFPTRFTSARRSRPPRRPPGWRQRPC